MELVRARRNLPRRVTIAPAWRALSPPLSIQFTLLVVTARRDSGQSSRAHVGEPEDLPTPTPNLYRPPESGGS